MEMTLQKIDELMSDCTLCPRRCHANRRSKRLGFCGQGAKITASRAALHFWEEPCICGSRGSGAVFFSGCSLKCVFCQNHDIALGKKGLTMSIERLAEVFVELQKKDAANINLVTAGHFLPQVCLALSKAKKEGLAIPIVYNSSGYEEVHSLRLLEGLVDIYLPDLKYYSPQLSDLYSHAPDYFDKASRAIAEMFRQAGRPVFSKEDGLMRRGVIVRHLLLPDCVKDSKKVLRYLHTTYGNDIYVSILSQYTPMPHLSQMPEPCYSRLRRKVTPQEYERVLDFADRIGIEKGYMQEGDAADASFIPPFDGEGILSP